MYNRELRSSLDPRSSSSSSPTETGLEIISWSSLPEDVREQIFDCVKDPIDILRCRSVCKSWLMSPSLSQSYRNYFPLCLIQRGFKEEDDEEEEEEESCRTLFQLSTNETFKICLPELKGYHIYGFSNGWLYTYNPAKSSSSNQMRLLHLISRDEILLPPSDTMHSCTTEEYFVGIFAKKVIVSTCPYTSKLIVVVQFRWSEVGFCRAGDKRWTSVLTDSYITDIMLYKGQFYGVDTCGKISCFQPGSDEAKAIDIKIPDSISYYPCIYLVESVKGDFLLVCSVYDSWYNSNDGPHVSENLLIYKLDLARKSREKVNSLSGQTLIICDGRCTCVPTHCSISEANFEGNSIFFYEGCDFKLRMHCLDTTDSKLLYGYGKKHTLLVW